MLPATQPDSALTAARSITFGIVSLVFGLPGALLLTALLALGSDLANAWAWVFGGFWALAVAAGHAVDLAVGDAAPARGRRRRAL